VTSQTLLASGFSREKPVDTALTIRIGDIGLRVLSRPGAWGFGLYEDVHWQGDQALPELTVRAHLGSLPELDPREHIFRSGGNWTLYSHDNQWVFLLEAPGTGPEPYALAVINREFSNGDVYVRRLEEFEVWYPDSLPNPLEYPLAELLMVHLLSQGRGHLFHACGVAYEGKGLLFAGVSVAGKSTIANLWKQVPGAAILSDDRIIIRKMDSQFWMYGTPWHGDAGVCAAGKVVLE